MVQREWDSFGRLRPGWICVESTLWLAERMRQKKFEPGIITTSSNLWSEDVALQLPDRRMTYVPATDLTHPSVQVIQTQTFTEMEPGWRERAQILTIETGYRPVEYFEENGVRGFVFVAMQRNPTNLAIGLKIGLVEDNAYFYAVEFVPGFKYAHLRTWQEGLKNPWALAQFADQTLPATGKILTRTRALTPREEGVIETVLRRNLWLYPTLLSKLTPNALAHLEHQAAGTEELDLGITEFTTPNWQNPLIYINVQA